MDTSQEGASFSISRKGYAREEVDQYVAAKERLLVDANHDLRRLQDRIAELEAAGSRVVQLEDDLARAQRKTAELEEKLEGVRTDAISGSSDGAELQAAYARIEQLEAQLATADDPAALQDALSRVNELEQQLAIATDDDGLALAQRRIHELETQLAALSDDDRLGHAQQRIEELEEQLASGGVSDDSVRLMLVEATRTRDQMLTTATEAADRSRADAETEAGRIVEQAVNKAQEIVGRAKSEAEAEREASAAAAARMLGEATDRVQTLRDESRDVLEQREADLRAVSEQHETEQAALVAQLAHMRDAYDAFEERLRFVAEAAIEEIANDRRGFQEFELPDPASTADPETRARQAVAGMIAEIEQHAEPEAQPMPETPTPTGEPVGAWHDPVAAEHAGEPAHASPAGTDADDMEAVQPSDDVAFASGEPSVEFAGEAMVDAAASVEETLGATEPPPVEMAPELAGEADDDTADVADIEPETERAESSGDSDEESGPEHEDEAGADEAAEAAAIEATFDFFADEDEVVGGDESESFYSKRGSKLPRLGDEAAKEALGGLNSLRGSFKD